MDLKILFILLVYYSVFSAFFLLGNVLDDFDNNIVLDDGELASTEIDQGGLFNTGVSFGRFFGLMTIGIGLPDDTPSWFQILFSLWQTLLLIFSAGFIISSIWDG
jgi:hypothetical protein